MNQPYSACPYCHDAEALRIVSRVDCSFTLDGTPTYMDETQHLECAECGMSSIVHDDERGDYFDGNRVNATVYKANIYGTATPTE